MCYQVTCQTCSKETWEGCGRHIDSVMSKIPAEKRCTCKRDDNKKQGTPMGPEIRFLAIVLITTIITYWYLGWYSY